jgi:hypothetical protein
MAQEGPGPMSWISLDTTKSGKSRQLIDATITEDGPMYDRLLRDGTLSSWGIAIPINHNLEDTWNFMLWTTFDDWGDVGKLQTGFESMFASRTPEQMMESQKAYADATVGGAHHDWIVRHHVHEVEPGKRTPRYFDIGYWTAKPGMGQGLVELFESAVAPIYARLKAEGVIQGYGIFTPELHGSFGWTHLGWASIADLADLDAVNKALDEGLTDEQVAKFMSMVEWESHTDQILLIVHLGGTEPESD